MARKTPQSSTNGVTVILIVALIAMLAIGAYYAGCQYWPRPAATAPALAQGDLVSENRIIFGGMPRSKRPEVSFTVLKNAAYIVGYSESRKDPLWSAYHVIHMDHPSILDRPKGEFLTDIRTQSRVTHHDFTGSGYDRGHMTPNSAIARCYGHEAQVETFLLSNICPQAPNLNQKVWEKLEADEFDYADQFGEVWVMDGPVFADLNEGTTHTLRTGIAVPSSFFKIIVENKDGKPKAFAVIMPQSVKGTELPAQFVTSIAEVEKETGLEFLWKLDAETRAELESKAFPQWPAAFHPPAHSR